MSVNARLSNRWSWDGMQQTALAFPSLGQEGLRWVKKKEKGDVRQDEQSCYPGTYLNICWGQLAVPHQHHSDDIQGGLIQAPAQHFHQLICDLRP